jgi:hypothetical protein
MRRIGAALFALFLCLPARAAGERPKKAAFVGLKAGAGVDPKIADAVSDAFAASLQRRSGLQLISTKDIETALGFEKSRRLAGCSDDAQCLAEIGGALGVEYLVSGSLARVGESRLFTAQVMDIRKATVLRRHQGRILGKGDDAFLDGVEPAITELFPGALPVASSQKALESAPGKRTAAWITGAAAVATAGAGVFFGLRARSQVDDARKVPQLDGAAYDQAMASARKSALAADICYGVAIAGAGVAAWLLATSPSQSVAISPAPLPGGGALVVGGRF